MITIGPPCKGSYDTACLVSKPNPHVLSTATLLGNSSDLFDSIFCMFYSRKSSLKYNPRPVCEL